ncbi:MAG: prolyl oligopeptidase family serine peptidase [Chloroflexota bacterium]|nr:prolyl oligopeptidase family serine peptidase [Chloroflexota bacterium]
MPRTLPRTLPNGRELVSAQAAIESFELSRDGSLVVYARRTVVGGHYRSHLWTVGWSGGRARRLTDGLTRDGSPAISPDGRLVAFVRGPAGGTAGEAQIWLTPLTGGPPRQVTRMRHGAASPRWSPDGKLLAFTAQAGEHRFAVGTEVKGKALRARRITRTDFRDDESGHLARRAHLFVAAARAGARPHQLTSGDFDVTTTCWAPDGTWLAFAADMGPDRNISPRSQLFRVPAGGGEVRTLASLAGDADRPAISPDGRQIAFVGTDVPDPADHVLTGLWVAPVEGGAPRPLTAELDRSVGCDAWADMVQTDDAPGPLWIDNETVAVIIASEGRNVPHRVTTAGEIAPLVPAGRLVGAALATGAGRVVLAAGNDRRAAEIYAIEASEHESVGHLRALTRNGSGWQDRFPLPRWDELWIDGPGGRMQAWLASPADAGDEPLPTILHIHGGPTGGWAPGGAMDSTMLAGHGYRVLMPNIRGSNTFGSDWIRALDGRWGDVDAADALAAVDHVIARGLADPQRLGVMGLSYGGYLTQWLVGATDRFSGAVAENGVANQVSAWANSYFGVHYNRRAKLGDPLSHEGMVQLWSTSPLSNVASITTPLLMLQAEEDRVCPMSDNEQLFTALRVLGREVEFITYPEEHHEMKSTGRPDRRIDRMERILAWFDRWVRAIEG